MTHYKGQLARPFPTPSPVIVELLDELRLAAPIQPSTAAEARRFALLARPWEPAACPAELRNVIYLWLEDVVTWINAEHVWRIDSMIPVCWMWHPHVLHELAVVACERWEASYASTPAALEAWQHYTLPAMLDRVRTQVGNGCPPGRHQPHPGQARNMLHQEQENLRRLGRLGDGR